MNTIKYILQVILSICVWLFAIAFCLGFWAFVAVLLLDGCRASAQDIYQPFRWTVNTARPALQQIEINRNETLPIEPQFVTYDGYVSLSNCVAVDLLYWIPGSNDANPWIVGGRVMDAAEGTAQIIWTPTNLVDAASVNFAVRLLGTDSASLKAQGKLKFTGTALEGITPNPVTTTTLDAATITLLNAGSWPFATVIDLAEATAAAEAAGAANTAQDGAIATNAAAIASNAVAIVSVETNLSAHVVQAEAKNDEQDAAIDAAAAAANMGKDVEGPSTNATVVAIQGIPVDPTPPTVFEDLYVLRYVHGTGMFTLMPAGTGSGTSISNIVLISDTAIATDVPFDKIGLYRGIRPGYLPTAVVNVGGYEVAWLDLLGITLKSGSINLLGSEMNVNVAAYDGSALAPAYSYAADRKLGSYRFAYQGGSAEGYAVNSTSVWYWAADGIHLQPGKQYFDLPAETDPLAIQASTTYVAWTNAGGTSATNTVVASSTLLTNGLASVTWTVSGLLSVRAETSTNQADWIDAIPTAAPVYLRVSVTNDMPSPGDLDTTVSDIVALSWTRPDLLYSTNNTAGQQIQVDDPQTARAIVNRQTLDRELAGIEPSTWADYPASTNVQLSGNRLILGYGWDISADSAGTSIKINGRDAMTIADEATGVAITSYAITSNTVYMTVTTNGVTSEPYPEWTPTLVPVTDWQAITNYVGSYPTATTNDTYTLTFPHQGGGIGYYRVQQADGPVTVTVHGNIEADNIGGKTVTHTWIDHDGITNALQFINGSLVSSTRDGVEQ